MLTEKNNLMILRKKLFQAIEISGNYNFKRIKEASQKEFKIQADEINLN